MKYRTLKIRHSIFMLGVGLIALAFLSLTVSKRAEPNGCYDQQIAAALQMQQCIERLREQPISEKKFVNDPNRTNLIGLEYSEITTTLGDMAAKRTSTNPDFAALLVKWFSELGVKARDVIAVGSSSSFPALTLATICAAEAMQVLPLIIVSLSASSYGANLPQWTYLDIESFLKNSGCIKYGAIAASLGGERDIASGLDAEGVRYLRHAAQRHLVFLIEEDDIYRNVQQRARLYEQFGKPAVFINVGGAQINVGDYEFTRLLKPGINSFDLRFTPQAQAMSQYFLMRGTPVIHLLNLRKLVLENNLPWDPIPLPIPGTAAIYYHSRIEMVYLWIAIGLAISGWGAFIYGRLKDDLLRRSDVDDHSFILKHYLDRF